MRLALPFRPLLVALGAMVLGTVMPGCSSPDAGDAAVDDTGATTDTGDTVEHDTDDTDSGALPPELNGAAPDEPIALPSFTARNMDGTTRTDADLLGHPTVIWFYPAAGTYG